MIKTNFSVQLTFSLTTITAEKNVITSCKKFYIES